MSQIYTSSTAAPPPDDVANKFGTDVDGPAIPSGNQLNIFGRESKDFDTDGIRTKNDTDGSNNVYTELTNRITGTATTTDGSTALIINESESDLANADGTYLFEGKITAYNRTDDAGGTYTFTVGTRSTGGTTIEIGGEQGIEFEESDMGDADFNFDTSGGSIQVGVTGIAGDTIDWDCQIIYRFVAKGS